MQSGNGTGSPSNGIGGSGGGGSTNTGTNPPIGISSNYLNAFGGADENPAGIGWTWDGTKFTAPEAPTA